MRLLIMIVAAIGALFLGACDGSVNAQDTAVPVQGQPYVLNGTQVWSVPDPVSGRDYDIFVSLPASYDSQPQRTYPVLYVTDADYAFPIIRQIARRVNLSGPVIEELSSSACPMPRATPLQTAAAATIPPHPTDRALQAAYCMEVAQPIRPI